VFDNLEHHWGTPQSVAVTMFAPSVAGNPQATERLASYWRAAASPGAAVAIMKMNREIDVRHVLPAIQAPTVVLHRSAERVIDIANARYMVEHIPGAKLIELPGFDHNYFVADRDALLDQVEAFLTGARHVHQPERVLTTVLFTDIVASTERAAALGDDAWRELLEAFYAQVREVLQQFRGREINTSAIAFSPPSKVQHGPSTVPEQSVMRCARSASKCAVACTPANATLSATTSPESRCILARVSPASLPRARCLSPRLYVT
jgi:hypothetical protein